MRYCLREKQSWLSSECFRNPRLTFIRVCFYISAEKLAWVNDEIIGRQAAAKRKEEDHKDDDFSGTGDSAQEENKDDGSEKESQETLILDATLHH